MFLQITVKCEIPDISYMRQGKSFFQTMWALFLSATFYMSRAVCVQIWMIENWSRGNRLFYFLIFYWNWCPQSSDSWHLCLPSLEMLSGEHVHRDLSNNLSRCQDPGQLSPSPPGRQRCPRKPVPFRCCLSQPTNCNCALKQIKVVFFSWIFSFLRMLESHDNCHWLAHHHLILIWRYNQISHEYLLTLT